MNFNQPSGSWELQLWLCQRVEELSTVGGVDKVLNAIGDELGFPIVEAHGARTNQYPAYVYAQAGGVTFLFVEGAAAFEQGALLVAGYGSPTTPPELPGCNPYLAVAAARIYQAGVATGLSPSSRIIMSGHSLGGAIVVAFHGLMCRNLFGSNRTTVTFGSPRTGQNQLVSLLAGEDITRLMNTQDAVALIPPQANQAPLCQLLVPGEQLVQWNRYEHVQGGQVQLTDGTRIATALPGEALLTPQLSLANWLASLPAALTTIHSISSYKALIELYGVNVGPSAPPAPPSPTRETHQPVTRQQIEQTRATTAANYEQIAQEKARVVVQIPDAYKFKAVRAGKIWSVEWMGRSVALGPQRGKCKELARRGNNFLSQMLRESDVGEDSMIDALLTWFVAAQDASSGIRPTQE